MLTVRFFALLREQLPSSELNWPWQQGLTVAALREQLSQQTPQWNVLQQSQVLCAVNHTLCGPEQMLQEGDEVAFFPPVTGG